MTILKKRPLQNFLEEN